MTLGSMEWWRQVPLQDIYWRLSLPPDVLGALDWVSGVILLNEDMDTFLRVDRDGAGNEHEEELVRTLTHEQTHYFQVLSTGYLYEHVNQLREISERCFAEAQAGKPVQDFDALVRLIDDPRMISTASLRPLVRLVAELRDTGRDGLSVLNIIEAHATYVEIRIRRRGDEGKLAELLDRQRISAEYRVAYDVARQRLGDEDAFKHFSLICFLALCSSHPVMSFGRLLDKLAVRRSASRAASLTVADLIETCCGYRYLGSPLDTASAVSMEFPSLTSDEVPQYKVALDALRESIAAGQAPDIFDFFRDPLAHMVGLGAVTYPTVLLNPVPTGGIPIRDGLPEDPDHKKTFHALLTAVICRRLLDLADSADFRADEQEIQDVWHTHLDAARAGDVAGYYNLGFFALRRGHVDAARVWWRLAAGDGDTESMKALAIAYSEIGDEERAASWFGAARSPASKFLPVPRTTLLQMGQEVDSTDSDAADECFRRAALRGDVHGAWLYGSRVVSRDPLEGLYYLGLAGGAGPSSPDAANAEALIRQLYKTWGRRTSRRLRKASIARWRKSLGLVNLSSQS